MDDAVLGQLTELAKAFNQISVKPVICGGLGVKCFPDFDEDSNKCWYWRLPKKEGEQPKIPGLEAIQARANEMLKRLKQQQQSYLSKTNVK